MNRPSLPQACGALSIFLALSFSANALAQTAPNLSPDTRGLPGLIQQYQQRPESRDPVPEPQIEAPPEPTIEQAPRPEDGQDAGLTQKFRVNDIVVEGQRHLPGEAAETLIAQYEGRDVSFLELRELANRLTDLYRQAGYVTSIVYIGPQKIENGRVILTAAEGVVGRITFENGKYFKKPAVLLRIDATDEGTFQFNDLKRSLRRINENPDMKVHAILQPGQQPEQTDIELDLTEEHFPFHVMPFWDNLGRPSIGVQRWGVTTTHNNLAGLGDQALNSVSWTRKSFGVATHYAVPVGAHGTWLNFDHSFSTLTVDRDFTDGRKLEGKAVIFSPSILQEVYTTDRMKISLDLAFDWQDIDTFLENRQIAQDRLKVLRPGLNWDAYDAWGRTMMRHEAGIGLDAGNVMLTSRPNGQADFVRYTGSVTRLQRLPLDSYGIFRAISQLTPHKLASIQQMQAGGAFTVRGYREGQFVGDYGYLFGGEWRVPLLLAPRNWNVPGTKYSLRDNLQLVSFLEFAGIHTNNPARGQRDKDYALGTGFGARINLTRHIAGRIDLGFPLIHRSGDKPRLHFGLETRLF